MAFKTPKPAYDAEVVARIEEYLDQDYLTEIIHTEKVSDDGIQYLYAAGRTKKSYTRPMFQLIWYSAFSGTGPRVTPCQCDRFDQSWACELHPELDWDPERERWKRPCTGDRTRCQCDPCFERRQRAADRSNGYVSDGTNGLWPPQGLTDSYRLVLRDGALRISRDIDYLNLTTVPEGMMGSNRWTVEGAFDPDALVYANGQTEFTRILEIDCETEQGAGPLAIEWEPSRDDTAA